ncbi:snRNA-activating protein complex subunit 2 [Melanotaenia boesemani]|uniref:snRNA-activating protein complex subunit 2 n=1 Tax=Melanotaenia boesemani TaxID=1250792 RepID=UPI001C04843B|nr:snRNA-activating protein complex subunit 2 [Melanotaenia boesemani]
MKPPPRTRGKRHCDPQPEATGPQRSRRPSGKWSHVERRKLLNGLRRLSKTAAKGDINYDQLRRYVTTRSVSEIRSMVDSLKTKVVSWASLKLKTRRREEERVRKPIEEWIHMSSSVTGGLEKTISTAFCQMLTVSSTEPCTLRNCDPPQVHRPPTEDPPPGRIIPMRPMPRMPVQDVVLVKDKTPASRKGPSSRSPAPSQQDQVKKSKRCPPQRPPVTSNQQDPVPGPITTSSAGPQTTSEQSPVTTVSTSPPSEASTSSSSTQPTPRVSFSMAASHTKFGKTSKYPSTMRTMGVKYVVDFEKIYMFLSESQKPNGTCCLTPMESAIMLDLLMSLPEELPLLDCNKLKNHLLQVYNGMSAPADSNRGRELLRGGISADCRREAESQSGQSHASSGQSEDGAAFEWCPPLNPFMVPLKLLLRR